MKKICKALCSILLAGALALGLSACGSNSGGTTATSTATANTLSDIQIVSANQSITIGWTDSTAPTGISSATAPTNTYNIYFSTSPGVKKNAKSGVAKIANVTSPYAHNGLSNGQTYYYVVTAVSPSGVESVESSEVSATPQASLPGAPTGITIAPIDSAITITLDHSHEPSNIQYNLYWYTDSSDLSKFNKITNAFPGTTADYPLRGLTNSTRYYFYVKADTGNGEGPASKLLSAIPMTQTSSIAGVVGGTQATLGAPYSVKARNGNQQVILSWAGISAPGVYANAPNGTAIDATNTNNTLAYNIYWSTDSPITVTGSTISSSSGINKIPLITGTTYTPTGLSNNHTYYYLITAVVTPKDGTGATIATNPIESAPTASAQVSVVPDAKTPAVPSGLYAVAGSQQVTLGWSKDKSTDTVIYNIYWSIDPTVINDTDPTTVQNNKKWNKIYSNIATNSYVHSGLAAGTIYYYMVTAQIGSPSKTMFDTTNGESAPSYMISATTLNSK